ncbi:MAG: hypothetical protein RLZZ263_127, partial [Cyanobacteriota bacterium]
MAWLQPTLQTRPGAAKGLKAWAIRRKLLLAAAPILTLQPWAMAQVGQPQTSSQRAAMPLPPPPPPQTGLSTTATPEPGSRPRPTAATSPPTQPIFAIVAADQQGVDGELGVYVAKGHVRLRFNGWTLLADRVEVAERSRSFYATGQVRLFKGNQYLQASSIRYSNWEGTGELEDVYGVIDQDTLQRDAAINPTTAAAGSNQPQPAAWPADPSFACPQLSASPNRRALSLIPPGSTPLPTMAAAGSCPGAGADPKPQRLMEALERVTFTPSFYKTPDTGGGSPSDAPNPTSRPIQSQLGRATIDQRVSNVAYQQSFSAGFQVNFGSLIGFTAPTNNASIGQLVTPRNQVPKGVISKIRFQSSNLQIQRDTWTARQMAFTNDPFTPARSWTIARNVTAAFNPDGSTDISARSGNIILENKVSLPAFFSQTLGKEQPSFAIDVDNQDRDG